ncbi:MULTISPECIES: hypothetical protein [Bradyrhizobium]|uniref:hypothetical protein n=1 Tax=Bradyrhizobium TaxID=374 RepID=UPI000AF30B25|nr:MULTISPECIES: hypothetical protein [Bradyrhizobium]
MSPAKPGMLAAAALCASFLSGCAVPIYDVPYDSAGQPTVKSIVDRIQCEIKEMVRDDSDDVAAFHGRFLLNGDYDAEISLSVEVNDTGGLAPNMSYLHPPTSFTFNVSGTLSGSRDHTFTENIQLSTREIYREWKSGTNLHECPPADTNLSGRLGLSDFVAMAALTPRRDDTITLATPGGVFGGTITFVITKNLSAIGPTWQLVNFTGPGALGSLSQVNTDKITVAFARGPNAGKPMPAIVKRPWRRDISNPYAHEFLNQLLTSSINTQLQILRNSLR